MIAGVAACQPSLGMNSLVGAAKICFCLVLAAGTVFLTGCQAPEYAFSAAAPAATNVTEGTPVSVPPNAAPGGRAKRDSTDVLRPGYKVTITFSGVTPLPPKHEEKIREDGYISPPLLGGPVMASGKTIGKLQEDLQDLYVPHYFKTLTVTVTTEDRFF